MNELVSSAVPTRAEAIRWVGKRVDDIYGKPIGRLVEIVTDPTTKDRDWLLVRFNPGADACTLVPLREASRAPKRVWVRFDREFVRSAPWVRRHAQLRDADCAKIARHYGLTEAPQRPRRFERRTVLEPASRAIGHAPAAVSARFAPLSG